MAFSRRKELTNAEKAEELALDASEILEGNDIIVDDVEEARKLILESLSIDPECLWAYIPMIQATPEENIFNQLIYRGIKIVEKNSVVILRKSGKENSIRKFQPDLISACYTPGF